MSIITNRQSRISTAASNLKEKAKHSLQSKNMLNRSSVRKLRHLRPEIRHLKRIYKKINKSFQKKEFSKINKLLIEESKETAKVLNNIRSVESSENMIGIRVVDDIERLIGNVIDKDTNLSHEDSELIMHTLSNIEAFLKNKAEILKSMHDSIVKEGNAMNKLKTILRDKITKQDTELNQLNKEFKKAV